MGQPRKPKGLSTGGQFSGTGHDEPKMTLNDDNPGCDVCGQADAVVTIDGVHYCEDCRPEEVLIPTTQDLSLSHEQKRTPEVGERVEYEGPMSPHETGTVVGTSEGYAGTVNQIVVYDDGRAIESAIKVSPGFAGWRNEDPKHRHNPIRLLNGWDGDDIHVISAGLMNPGYVVVGVGDTDHVPFIVQEVKPVGTRPDGRTAAWRYSGEPLNDDGQGPYSMTVGVDAQIRLLTGMPNGGRQRWDGTGDADDWRTRVHKHLDSRSIEDS